jgi:hypothetical protein
MLCAQPCNICTVGHTVIHTLSTAKPSTQGSLGAGCCLEKHFAEFSLGYGISIRAPMQRTIRHSVRRAAQRQAFGTALSLGHSVKPGAQSES